MTADEITKAAARRISPGELDLPGQLLYAIMRRVYADYAFGLITQDAGEREKAKAIIEYNRVEDMLRFYDRATAQSAERYKRTEAARTAARKNPCAETAIALADAIDGL